MCGIAGVFGPDGLSQPRDRLESMATTIAHRGPDDRGTWHDECTGLAATRLAIFDLSPAGHQPMEDDGVVIAFNGEAYNFRDLRRELEAHGHRFRSDSDTEVVLQGYRRWGVDVVPRLRGMFGLAIWDAGRRQLLLARDRMGQKPLYYAWHDGCLVFGSEVKAILAWGVPATPDLTALRRYLRLRYVPGEQTAFEGIRRLPPAHVLTVGDGGGVAMSRYWTPPTPGVDPGPGVAAEIRDRLDEAVRLRMQADVPVGAFLSGGIDSSAIVATMSAASDHPIRTFTVGFERGAIDERAAARIVSERYGTDHTELSAEVDVAELATRIAWFYGEPYADPVAIPTYLLAQEARRHVTVVLTGDGGDEIFLGYRRHAASQAAAYLDVAPYPLRRAVARAARARGGGSFPMRFLGALDATPAARFGGWVDYLADDLRGSLYDDPLRSAADEADADVFATWFTGTRDVAAQAAAADLGTFLPDELLVRIDVATMAHGLEARSPFLDHELVELALSLPVSRRIPRLRTKGLLRTALADRLPPELVGLPKLGFPMPLSLERPGTESFVRDVLSRDAVRGRGLLRPDGVAALLDGHFSGVRAAEQPIWTLVMLELWFQTWVDPAVALSRERGIPC